MQAVINFAREIFNSAAPASTKMSLAWAAMLKVRFVIVATANAIQAGQLKKYAWMCEMLCASRHLAKKQMVWRLANKRIASRGQQLAALSIKQSSLEKAKGYLTVI